MPTESTRDRSAPRHLFGTVIGASFALHVALVWALPNGAPKRPVGSTMTIEIVAVTPTPPPTPTIGNAPDPEPPHPPRPHSAAIVPTAHAIARPAPAATQLPPAATSPVPSEMPHGPTPPMLAAATGTRVAVGPASSSGSNAESAPATTKLAPDGRSQLVAAKDLGRAPRAPRLDAALERNYPREARWNGISGSAVLRLQIMSDGRIGSVRIISATHADFAAACERTVKSSLWQPAQDRQGGAVATEITYTCRFELSG